MTEYKEVYKALCGESGILEVLNKALPESSRRFTTHSARVGGCCTLHKAGLSKDVVQEIGDWANVQMVIYSKKLFRGPECVKAVPFYNPALDQVLAH